MEVPMELVRILINEGGEAQVIVVQERDGERRFPVSIGFFEAAAIDRRLKRIPIPRPMTHELLAQTIASLGDGQWREYAGGYADYELARSRDAGLLGLDLWQDEPRRRLRRGCDRADGAHHADGGPARRPVARLRRRRRLRRLHHRPRPHPRPRRHRLLPSPRARQPLPPRPRRRRTPRLVVPLDRLLRLPPLQTRPPSRRRLRQHNRPHRQRRLPSRPQTRPRPRLLLPLRQLRQPSPPLRRPRRRDLRLHLQTRPPQPLPIRRPRMALPRLG